MKWIRRSPFLHPLSGPENPTTVPMHWDTRAEANCRDSIKGDAVEMILSCFIILLLFRSQQMKGRVGLVSRKSFNSPTSTFCLKLGVGEPLLKIDLFYFTCECFACLCDCAHIPCSTHRGQKRALHPLELDLLMVTRCRVGSGN